MHVLKQVLKLLNGPLKGTLTHLIFLIFIGLNDLSHKVTILCTLGPVHLSAVKRVLTAGKRLCGASGVDGQEPRGNGAPVISSREPGRWHTSVGPWGNRSVSTGKTNQPCRVSRWSLYLSYRSTPAFNAKDIDPVFRSRFDNWHQGVCVNHMALKGLLPLPEPDISLRVCSI